MPSSLSLRAAVFLSTPSARRATKILDAVCRVDGISIHALREEGDRPCWFYCHPFWISIHALREEGDLVEYGLLLGVVLFLSTPSARRAT